MGPAESPPRRPREPDFRDGLAGLVLTLAVVPLVAAALAAAPPRTKLTFSLDPDHLDTSGQAAWLRVGVPGADRGRLRLDLDGSTPRHLWSANELRVGTPPLERQAALLEIGVRRRGGVARETHVPIVAGPFLRLDRWEGEAIVLHVAPGDLEALGWHREPDVPGPDPGWLSARFGPGAPAHDLPGGGTLRLRVARVRGDPVGGATLWLDARVAGSLGDDWGRVTDPGAASAIPPDEPVTALGLSGRFVAGALATAASRKAVEARLRAHLAARPVPRLRTLEVAARPALFLAGNANLDWVLPVVRADVAGAPGLELTVFGTLRLEGSRGVLARSRLVPEVSRFAHRCRVGDGPRFVPCLDALGLLETATLEAMSARAQAIVPDPPAVEPLLRALLGDRASSLEPLSVAVADDLAATVRLGRR